MSKKILIIDDETDFLMVVQTRLEANGFIVITAIDGENGLEKAKKEKPNLIILDLLIPKINGEEVCKRLKKDPETKNIPVIALTASGHPDIEKNIIKCGASDFMQKPFESDDLLLKIKKALGEKMRGKCLIADDEPGIIESLRLILEKLEHQVEGAVDGTEASELIKNNKYDFVFLDINMPELTGIELIKEVKRVCPQTVIVITTGYSPMNSGFAISAGAHEYIEKPFSAKEVESIIRKYR